MGTMYGITISTYNSLCDFVWETVGIHLHHRAYGLFGKQTGLPVLFFFSRSELCSLDQRTTQSHVQQGGLEDQGFNMFCCWTAVCVRLNELNMKIMSLHIKNWPGTNNLKTSNVGFGSASMGCLAVAYADIAPIRSWLVWPVKNHSRKLTDLQS